MQKKHLGIFLIIALAIANYANTFDNEFVWDEKVFIKDNL
jgi:hypothetical protein